MESIDRWNMALELHQGTLICFAHDREFVSSLATRVIKITLTRVISNLRRIYCAAYGRAVMSANPDSVSRAATLNKIIFTFPNAMKIIAALIFDGTKLSSEELLPKIANIFCGKLRS